MKQREQAQLLRKAAQDEALLDEVLTSDQVSDDFAFHCHQAAEKILKSRLSDLGVHFRKTHEIGAFNPHLYPGSGYRACRVAFGAPSAHKQILPD